MKKILFLCFLFFFASCKEITSQEFGVEIPFDQNNNEFQFLYQGDSYDVLIIYVDFNGRLANFEYHSKDCDANIEIDSSGLGYHCPLNHDQDELIIKIKNIEATAKGTIWLNL